jgi:ankyrin repeat protein
MTNDLNTQRLTELADRLAAATTTRIAQWQLDGDDVFVWIAPEGSVTVGSRDRDGEPPYELAVYNPTRERVDELTSERLTDDRPAPWNDALVELYRAARRSALRADDIIDSLIEALPAAGADSEAGRSFLSGARTNADASGAAG